MRRRRFVQIGSALAGTTSISSWSASLAARATPAELKADVAIIGGSLGGVAAALGACRAGCPKVILACEVDWIGGQLTSQLVPPDEHQFIEGGGSTRSYQQLRNLIRDHYRQRKEKPLTSAARKIKNLNPGNGWVSRLCCEPKVAEVVMRGMLAPYLATGQLTLLNNVTPVAADVDGTTTRSVTIADPAGVQNVIHARYFLDATDEGDLLPLTKTPFITGTESKAQTGEPNAADKPRPGNVQSFTCCFVVEHCDGEQHTIDKPADYEFWKKQTLGGQPIFQWTHPKPYAFYPLADRDPADKSLANFWTYRRIIDRRLFEPGSYRGDVSVINYHQNDYALGSSHANPDPKLNEKHRLSAKELSRAFLYWLQTECPRLDGKAGWPGLRLCPEHTGTKDGFAMANYIRESRRIDPVFRVLQQHVSVDHRIAELGPDKATAMEYRDTIGVGLYLYIDIHKTCEGYSNGGGGKVFPFQIPLGALLSTSSTNVLPACKNLGVTHLTNGCFRLHPIEWNVGESAGVLATYCLANKTTPFAVREQAARLADYQAQLSKLGIQLAWPKEQLRG